MIHFTPSEIFSAAFAFFAFGGVFGILLDLQRALFDFVRSLFTPVISGVFNKSPDKPSCFEKTGKRGGGYLSTLLSPLLFSLCFILVSFAALDGEIRAWAVLLSLGALMLQRRLVSPIFNKILQWFLRLAFTLISTPLIRVFGLPFKIAAYLFKIIENLRKKHKKCQKVDKSQY